DARERLAVEPGDDIARLEPGFVGRPARRHAIDPCAHLVRRVSDGVDEHANAATIAAEIEGVRPALGPRRAGARGWGRLLCSQRELGDAGQGQCGEDPGALHDSSLLGALRGPRTWRG